MDLQVCDTNVSEECTAIFMAEDGTCLHFQRKAKHCFLHGVTTLETNTDIVAVARTLNIICCSRHQTARFEAMEGPDNPPPPPSAGL